MLPASSSFLTFSPPRPRHFHHLSLQPLAWAPTMSGHYITTEGLCLAAAHEVTRSITAKTKCLNNVQKHVSCSSQQQACLNGIYEGMGIRWPLNQRNFLHLLCRQSRSLGQADLKSRQSIGSAPWLWEHRPGHSHSAVRWWLDSGR